MFYDEKLRVIYIVNNVDNKVHKHSKLTKQLGKRTTTRREMSIYSPKKMVVGQFTCVGHKEHVIVHKLFRYIPTKVLKPNNQQNVHRSARLHISLNQ